MKMFRSKHTVKRRLKVTVTRVRRERPASQEPLVCSVCTAAIGADSPGGLEFDSISLQAGGQEQNRREK